MEQKTTDPTPLQIVGVSCGLVLALACLCSVVTLGILGDFGRAITDPLRRLFRQPPAEFTLAYALSEGLSGTFRLGPDCEILSARGESFDSSQEPFQRDISPTDAAEIALAALETDTYMLDEGLVRLMSGLPVQASYRRDQVDLGYSESGSSGSGNWSRSVSGIVEGDIYQGDFYLSEKRSEVIGGQGLELSTTVQATFRCPLTWVDSPFPDKE